MIKNITKFMIVICVAFASETVHDPFRLDTVIEPNNQVAVVTKNNKVTWIDNEKSKLNSSVKKKVAFF